MQIERIRMVLAITATALLACSSGGSARGGNSAGGGNNDGGGNNAGGGNDSGGSNESDGGGSCFKTTQRELVTNHLKLPTSADTSSPTAFAYDLNGDQKPDNRFAGLLSILNGITIGGEPQSALDAAIASEGSVLLLMRVDADSLAASTCAELTVGTAAPNASPDFSGNGDFALDGSPTKLPVAIGGGSLQTPDPVGAATPSTLALRITLFAGAMPITLPLVAAHLAGTLASDGGSISNGVIHGAIKNSDLRETVIPATATSFNALLQDPSTPANTKSAITTLLDKGCANGEGFANDQFIDPCEVWGGAFKSAFTPDLDLYADTSRDVDGNTIGSYGVYAPTPSGATSLDNDAWSFGIGFNAVGAAF